MSDKRTSARHRSAARRRMAQTGEKYTVALAAVLADVKRGIDPESSTVITGAPGYGFTTAAIEKMESRFPDETDDQIRARMIAEVEADSVERSIDAIESAGALTKALTLAASNVSIHVGGVTLRDQLETMRDALGHSGLERAKALIDIARPKLSDPDVRTLDSLVLTVNDSRRAANTAAALNNIQYALSTLDMKTVPDHLKRNLSRIMLGASGYERTRVDAVPSQRLNMDAVYQIVARSLDDENTHVYLWSRDLSDFNELLEHYDGAERDEDALGALLASARTHGDEKVIVVIDHQGVLSHHSADLLSSLASERKDIEIIYVERRFVDEHRRVAPKSFAREIIATRLAPAQFGVFGVADTIIDMLNNRGVRILRDQPLDVNPISEGTDNLAKSYVRDVIRLALIERGLRADSYDIAQHADAVIESLVATGLVSFPEEMLRSVIGVDPKGSSTDIAEATGGKTIDLGALATGDTIDPLGNSDILIEESWSVGASPEAKRKIDEFIRSGRKDTRFVPNPRAGIPFAIGGDGETLTFDSPSQSPHEMIVGLAGTGALKSPEYDAIFGRVVPLDTPDRGAALRAETKVFTEQNLPYITLDTGQRRREAAAEAIDEYSVYALVVTYEPDYYSGSLAITVHPDDLTAEIVESPMIGYYVIDDVKRAVEDLNGMSLITSLVATARAKERAIRLLQSRGKDVPAAIAGAVTRRIKSGNVLERFYAPRWNEIGRSNGIPFATGIGDVPMTFLPERDGHCLVSGMSGSGKSVIVRGLAYGALVNGWDVAIVNSVTGGAEYRFAEGYLRASATDFEDHAAAADLVKTIYAEVARRVRMNSKHGVANFADLPEGIRPNPLLLIIDEFTSMLEQEKVPSRSDDAVLEEDREKIIADNNAKLIIARYIGKILREARSVGVTVILATQKLSARSLDAIPGGKAMKSQLSSILVGNTTFADRMSALRKPEDAPDLGTEVPPGRGIYEPSTGEAQVFQAWYAPESEYRRRLETVRDPISADERDSYLSTETDRDDSEKAYGLLHKGTGAIYLDGELYARIFEDGTGIDFTQFKHLIVTGEAGSGKTVLMGQIVKKMRDRGFEVNIASPRPFEGEYGEQDKRSVFEIIEHVHKTMSERFVAMRARGLNHAQEADDMPPVFLIVDYADYIFDGHHAGGEPFGNAEEVEVAAERIRNILRVSRAADVHLIVGQNRVTAESKIASGEAGRSYAHRILLGRPSHEARATMFSKRLDYDDSTMTRGDGIYQDANGNIRRVHVQWVRGESGTDRP